jgi:Fusaric acid resistance protein-like
MLVRIQKQNTNGLDVASRQSAAVVVRGVVLAISCVITYWLITHILAGVYSVSRDDDALGGMWAVVATIFVYRYSNEESVHAALSRMAATSVSFVLCVAYLLIFPFNVWGMGALIGIGAIVLTIAGRPEDAMTTGITTAVVMVVASLSPHDAWRQPILRLVDTALGVAIGVVGSRLVNLLSLLNN